jgi:hypothetical protein
MKDDEEELTKVDIFLEKYLLAIIIGILAIVFLAIGLESSNWARKDAICTERGGEFIGICIDKKVIIDITQPH